MTRAHGEIQAARAIPLDFAVREWINHLPIMQCLCHSRRARSGLRPHRTAEGGPRALPFPSPVSSPDHWQSGASLKAKSAVVR